jgi:DNA mismatch repair ATPase MutS
MSFIADRQTLDDLNLLGRFKQGSVFSLFNKVHTKGGENLLETMFKTPLTDHQAINERSRLFSFFQNEQLDFPFDAKKFETAINYLDSEPSSSPVLASAGMIVKSIQGRLLKDEKYETLKNGFDSAIVTLKTCKDFFRQLDPNKNPFGRQVKQVARLFNDPRLGWLDSDVLKEKTSIIKFSRFDHLLRSVLVKDVRNLLEIIHELDVCIAVAKVAAANNFSYATAYPSSDQFLKAEELQHPTLKKAVGNEISLDQKGNVVFLTGANMAGKSTLMKTVGVSFYLAHMGFPIAAKQMDFSVKAGIFSSINTPDDLKMGYSHFYAEVMRVKKVAEEVALGKHLLVIFDELFKGTNVKDAYDATLAVTEAFALYHNCFFIISTHIIEVGESLKRTCDNLQFKYLPTIVENNIPRYTYKLSEGITSDRQGMMIIENEGILELLNLNRQQKPFA